jgi:predicted hydrolase (HD superfamily)
MISREEAFKLVTTWTENKNLVKHMLCVEAAMGGLAKHFNEDKQSLSSSGEYDENLWKIVGLLHDADYDKYPDKHPQVLIDELEKLKQPGEII